MRRVVPALLLGLLVILSAAPANAADGDGDGVGNARDRCPSIRAVGRPDGCPLGAWRLGNANATGPASFRFRFRSVAEQVVVGDWNNDGVDTLGTFDPVSGRWRLAGQPNGASDPPTESITLTYEGITAGRRIPVTGDWNGDGTDTVGVYDPASGTFHLRNSNSTGSPDLSFSFGGQQPAAHVRPVAGDWNGDGTDTVGIFRRDTNRWRLRDANSAGPPAYDFVRGRAGNGEAPLVGDADGDGTDAPGITWIVATEGGSGLATGRRQYKPWLSMEPGGAGLDFSWGETRPTGTGAAGFLGDWDGNGTDTPGLRHR